MYRDKMYLPESAGPLAGTSRLGVGMATIMRESSAAKRQKLLDAAFEIGYRHFDVAPLYGLGTAERELGSFLARGAMTCTVGTKFGLLPGRLGKLAARVQRPVRFFLQVFPQARSMTRALAPKPLAVHAPSFQDLHESVARSADRLGRGSVDVFMTHEVVWNDQWDATWEETAARADELQIRALGLSGTATLLTTYPPSALGRASVLQVLWTGDLMPSVFGNHRVIGYGALSSLLPLARATFRVPATRRRLGELLGQPVAEDALAAVLVASLLNLNPQSTLLVGSTSTDHLRRLWVGVAQTLEADCIDWLSAFRTMIDGPVHGTIL